MASQSFDYIIVGNGLAGLQLGLRLASDSYFAFKRIVLIDKSAKTVNDKTWCFWEKGDGKWQEIVHKTWEHGLFLSEEKKIELDLAPYNYKMIRSSDFYSYCKAKLNAYPNVSFIEEEVTDVQENEEVEVLTTQQNYKAKHVFDSRLPKAFSVKEKSGISIQQHFKGWLIETKEEQFDPEQFVMMDFSLRHKESTSFGYILPLTEKRALVEYTFFTPFMVEDKTYDALLEEYIKTRLNLQQYTITETEKGNIPMTSFPFYKYHSQKTTKIGTAGGWVKPATGYSFKFTEKKVEQIIYNLKNNRNPSTQLQQKKYPFYDKIYLSVLANHNHKGKWIYENFYEKNEIQDIFKYLDEETSLTEDFKIMKSLFSFEFIQAFFRTL